MPISPRPIASRRPATMNGRAAGSTMFVHSCPSLQRKARPTSIRRASTFLTPWYVLMTIGKKVKRNTTTILADVSKPIQSTRTGTSATDGIEYSAVM